MKDNGKVPGIYASYYMWESIMGTAKSCPDVAGTQLWYAHYDNKQTFSDYAPFGGWTKPAIKQYKGDTTLCSFGVDLDYY